MEEMANSNPLKDQLWPINEANKPVFGQTQSRFQTQEEINGGNRNLSSDIDEPNRLSYYPTPNYATRVKELLREDGKSKSF